MTNIELQFLLDEIAEQGFLGSIQLIIKNEPKYKKSDFYKETKIPLSVLYEKYLQYVNLTSDKVSEMIAALNGMDIQILSDKLADLLAETFATDKMKNLVNEFQSQFNIEELMEQNSELEELITNLKE